MTTPTHEQQGHPPGRPATGGPSQRSRGASGLILAAVLGLVLGIFLGNVGGLRLTSGPVAMVPLGEGFSFAVAVWGAAVGGFIGATGGALLYSWFRHAKERRKRASERV